MALYTGNIKFTATDTEPTSGKGRIYYDESESQLKHHDGSNWVSVNSTTLNGATSSLAALSADHIQNVTGGASDGVYWINPDAGTAIQTWCVFDSTNSSVLGGTSNKGYVMLFCATNANGYSNSEWYRQQHFDNTSGYEGTGTNVPSWSSLVKKNMKSELWWRFDFDEILLIENHSDSVGYRSYLLNSDAGGTTNSFWDWTEMSHGSFTNRATSNPISGGTSNMKAFTTSNIDFMSRAGNAGQDDGGVMVPEGPSSECSGGFMTQIDGSLFGSGRWSGILTRNDSGRHYNSDGTTTDHSLWVFGRDTNWNS